MKKTRFIEVETRSGNAYIDLTEIIFVEVGYKCGTAHFRGGKSLELIEESYYRIVRFIDELYDE